MLMFRMCKMKGCRKVVKVMFSSASDECRSFVSADVQDMRCLTYMDHARIGYDKYRNILAP